MANRSMNWQNWIDSGDWLSLDGHRVFYHDSAKQNDNERLSTANDKPCVVILHGYPTSTYDYHKVYPVLSQHFRVVMHDHLGFGASDKPENYSYSFIEQADMAIRLWESLNIKNCFIIAHDYGTSVATEILHRLNNGWLPLSIDGLVMSNGSVHIELSQLRLIQKLLRRPIIGKWVAKLSNDAVFRKNMRNIYFDASKVSDKELAVHWSLLTQQKGRERLPVISQYTYERFRFWHRWIGAIKNSQIPLDLIWARNDPVAVPKIAETLHQEAPRSSLKWLDECGHFPMLEKSEEWTEDVIQAIEERRNVRM